MFLSKLDKMKIIYRIAKTELQMLFYSPIAWLLLLCFVIQTGLVFTDLYGNFVISMDEYDKAYRASRTLFAWGDHGAGLWPQVQSFLYFYIPLLTMGMVSRDLSSGLSNYCILHRLAVRKSFWENICVWCFTP